MNKLNSVMNGSLILVWMFCFSLSTQAAVLNIPQAIEGTVKVADPQQLMLLERSVDGMRINQVDIKVVSGTKFIDMKGAPDIETGDRVRVYYSVDRGEKVATVVSRM